MVHVMACRCGKTPGCTGYTWDSNGGGSVRARHWVVLMHALRNRLLHGGGDCMVCTTGPSEGCLSEASATNSSLGWARVKGSVLQSGQSAVADRQRGRLTARIAMVHRMPHLEHGSG